MKILIGFSTSRAWYSRIIRYLTGAKVSHTFLLLRGALLGEDMVLEASMLGFTLRTFSAFKTAGNQIVSLRTPKVPLDGATLYALQWLDKFYDYTGLLGMGWVELGKHFKRQWSNPLHTPNALFCSESVAKILQLASYPGAEYLSPESTSPADLLEFLSNATVS